MSQNQDHPQGSGQYPDFEGSNGQGYGQPQRSQDAYQQPQPNQQYIPYQGQPAQYDQPSAYQQYGQLYGAAPAAPATKSSTLGLVGFGIVIVCAIVLSVVSYQIGGGYARLLVDLNIDPATSDPEVLANDPRFQEFAMSLATPFMLGLAASIAGLVGWIISIVATAQNRGRGFGIAGIVIGVLAPIIAFFVMSAGLAPFIAQFG